MSFKLNQFCAGKFQHTNESCTSRCTFSKYGFINKIPTNLICQIEHI